MAHRTLGRCGDMTQVRSTIRQWDRRRCYVDAARESIALPPAMVHYCLRPPPHRGPRVTRAPVGYQRRMHARVSTGPVLTNPAV